VRVIDPVMADN